MLSSKPTSVIFVTLFTILIFFIRCTEEKKNDIQSENIPTVNLTNTDSAFLATNGSMATNDPDKFNWMVFAMICKPAQTQVNVKGNLMSNNVIWETWPDDPATYPPAPSLDNPPVWPVPHFAPTGKKFEKITQQELRRQLISKSGKLQMLTEPEGDNEEVRRNPASFDFIVKKGLWYVEGLAKAFGEGTSNGYHPIIFPVNAVEIKAVWKKITKDSMSFYHWNYDASGELYGLIALHIMTKALPNWTWATWEWVGNPARCDFTGCSDAYGSTPSNMPPNSLENQGYQPGQLTPELLKLLTASGISDEWKNYRLKGSQTDWIDPTGRTTLLGNSITEAGFVQSSSCITCHARASFDKNGHKFPHGGFMPDFQSPNGPVSPADFWTNSKPPFGAPVFLQYDFVWGLTKANNLKK